MTDGRPQGTSGDVRLSREVAQSRSAVAPEKESILTFLSSDNKSSVQFGLL